MKKYIKYTVAVIIMIMLLLSSCGRAEDDNSYDVTSIYSYGYCWMEDGILIYTSGDDGLAMFYDLSSGEYMPVCAKANCLHNDSDCFAVYLYENVDIVGRIDDKWYYVASGADGDIYSCDLDGSNEKLIGSLGHGEGWDSNTVSIFYDHYLITATCDDEYDETTYEWISSVSAIYRYDLDTGKAQLLCDEIDYLRPSYCLLGMIDSKIVYTEYDGEKDVLRLTDLDTGETEQPLGDTYVFNALMKNDNVFYVLVDETGENGFYAYDLESGENTLISYGINTSMIFWEEDIKLLCISEETDLRDDDGLVVYNVKIYSYEGSAGELMLLYESYTDESGEYFWPLCTNGDDLIGTLNGSTDVLYSVSTEDYLAGKSTWTLLGE